MDAVKFIEEKSRMCETFTDCYGCPVKYSCNPDAEEAKETVAAVEKWSKEHPRKKTNGDMIKALLPKERKYTLPFKDIITINLDKDWWDAEYKEERDD